MTSFLTAVRDGWRNLRRALGTTLTATLLLGSGFAISLMITSIAMVAFDGFGTPIPTTVEAIGEADGHGNVTATRGADIDKLRAAAPELASDLVAVRTLRLSLGGSERNQSVQGALVVGPLFDVLAWPMQLGRGFRPGDAQAGAAVLGHDLWRDRFASDPAVIGQSVSIDGRQVSVIGVLPDHRSYPFHEQLYLAYELDARSPFYARYWELLADLRTPAQRTQLQAAIAGVQAEREQLLGEVARTEPLASRPFHGNGVPAESQVMIGMLLLLGGLLLLLASSNAGGLLLVHWLARNRELATRAALGGTRARLFLTCLLQATLLVALALAMAHVVAAVLLHWLESYLHAGSDGIPQYARLTLDPGATWPVLLAGIGCVLVVALPVLWRLGRTDLTAQIRSGDRGSSGSSWLGSGLFGVQCLLSGVTVLLALLCAQGAREMLLIDVGLDTRQVLTARFSNTDLAAQQRIGRAFKDMLAREPALAAHSVGASLPLLVNSPRNLNVGDKHWELQTNPVDAGYAEVFGVQLQAGTWIRDDQVESGATVAVLDRAAAELLFPGQDPIGQSFEQQEGDGSRIRYTVQGVIGPVRTTDGLGPDQPSVFVPMQWSASGGLVVAVRTRAGDPLDFAPRLEQMARQVDPALALDQLRSFAQVRHAVGASPRLIVTLFSPLAILALLLAATGLAALLGSLVARRLRELGIRRALGAGGGALLRPLLNRLGLWGGGGLLLGLLLSWPLAVALSEGLFGGAVLGPLTYLVTLSMIGMALVLAAAAPIRRALRVDPMLVLRED